MKSKIIFSNYDDLNNPYYNGGGAFAIHNTAKKLTKKHYVSVITGKYPKSKNLTLENIQYIRIGTDKFGPRIGQLIFQFLLPYYVFTMNFDIWFESFTPPFSTAFLQLFTKRHVVGITHFLNAEEKSKEYKFPFYIIERIGLKTYKNIIALSPEIESKVRKYNKNVHIKIIPNGIDIPNKKYRDIELGSYGLFIGRIEVTQKGLDLLIQSFKKSSHKIKDKLLIAGTGSSLELEKLNNLIKENKLTERIELIGRVEGNKKVSIMAKSKYIVMPSRYENFSLVSLESIALGKPIICFDIYGLKWIPNEIAVKVKPFSVSKYSENIILVSKNKQLQKKIKIESVKLAESFTWTNVIKGYEDLINKLMKEYN